MKFIGSLKKIKLLIPVKNVRKIPGIFFDFLSLILGYSVLDTSQNFLVYRNVFFDSPIPRLGALLSPPAFRGEFVSAIIFKLIQGIIPIP
jgi:hypothetical protein